MRTIPHTHLFNNLIKFVVLNLQSFWAKKMKDQFENVNNERNKDL